jgi:CRISPR-associated protein Cmr5
MSKYKKNPPTPPRVNTPPSGVIRPTQASAPVVQRIQTSSSIQTLAQKRAKHALDQIEGMKPKDDGHLCAHIAGFPAMILMSGFGQACAFYLSKGNTTNGKLMKLPYLALESWLTSTHRPYSVHPGQLMYGITQSDSATYRLAEAEALAYLDWLKKFAKAFLKSPEAVQTSSETEVSS